MSATLNFDNDELEEQWQKEVEEGEERAFTMSVHLRVTQSDVSDKKLGTIE